MILISRKVPRAIKEYLSSKIYGQEEAVKAASILLYNHIRKRKRNILFIGPTGCGKTEIWRVMKKIYPNIRIVDSSAITMQGWSGGFKIQDIFRGMKTEEIEKSIIVFDEFDKFCEPLYSGSGANYSAAGQNELLKMIEGSRISFGSDNGREAVDFDSSGMSFVFCGSFEQLVGKKTASEQKESIGFGRDGEKKDAGAQYLNKITAQDLIEYAGVRQEIAGRIQQIVQLHPMTEKISAVFSRTKRFLRCVSWKKCTALRFIWRRGRRENWPGKPRKMVSESDTSETVCRSIWTNRCTMRERKKNTGSEILSMFLLPERCDILSLKRGERYGKRKTEHKKDRASEIPGEADGRRTGTVQDPSHGRI